MATEFIPIAVAQLSILVVAALSRWLSRRRPHLSHLLWLVVLIKCVTPPLWASPGGVFCWLQPEQQIEILFVENVEWTPVAWDVMLELENASTMDFETSSAPFAGAYLDVTAEAELTAALSVVEPPSDQPFGDRVGNATLVAWAVISGLVLLGVTIRWLRFWRLVRSSPRRDSPELDTMLQTLSKQLGVHRRVRLIVTESLVGPAVVGFFRVTVLIPAVVADKLKGESVAPILAHELLHVRRGDLWVGLLQTVAQALWWFHPLVWWVGRMTNREAERCCDEEVLGELKCDPASYARALLDVLDLKSQLKPVPVFPGVRPVDVTSQRLERIMSLRQGCRRRTPWWCWLVAIGAAALTLPGAAFVATAQEEEPLELTADKDSKSFPAPPVYLAPGSGRPMPLPRDTELTAYSIGASHDAPTTKVYDITEFVPLLSGNESEKQQKFERLVRSRDVAHDAQVNWFNGQPVIKTTAAGHEHVRQCVGVLLGSGATSETVDAYIDSLTKQSQSTLVIDLQLITLGENAHGNVKDAVSDVVETGKESSPWVLPAETWEAILESEKKESIGKKVYDGVSDIFHPRLVVFNGRSVMVESGAKHPVSLKREDDGRLVPGGNWSGWKAHLLPFVCDDGSFWLGVSIENGKVVGTTTLSPQQAKQIGSEGTATVLAYQKVEFSTTMKEGQVVVLPGFEIAHGDETSQATLITARVRRHSNKPSSKAVSSPRQISGTGVNSDAGIQGSVTLDAQDASDQESKTATAHGEKPTVKQKEIRVPEATKDATQSFAFGNDTDGRGRIIKQHGPFRIEAGLSPEYRARMTPGSSVPLPTNMQITLSRSAETGKEPSVATGRRLDMRADQTSSHTENGTLILMLKGNVELRAGDSSSDKAATFFTANADSLEISVPKFRNTDVVTSVPCRMTKATVLYGAGVESTPSMIRAEDISITLNAETFEIASLNASNVDSIQVSDLKQKTARSRTVFPESRQLLSQWDTIRRRRSFQKLVSPSFDRVPLKEAIAWFRESASLNILIDEAAIEEEGISTSTPVTLELKDVQADSVLRLLLRPLNLGVTVDDESGVVIVTSLLRMKGKMTAAAYPVADLVIPIPKSVHIRLAGDGLHTLQPAIPTALDGVKQVSASSQDNSQLDLESISELITTVVEPDSWQEVGGVGTLHPNQKTLSLVIRQTQETHREISDLLDQLRRLHDITIDVKTELLRASDELVAGFKFQTLSKTNRQRFAIVSQEEVAVLRRGATSQSLPKISLFNTQTCELYVDKGGEGDTELMLQPIASADHSVIRMAVGCAGLRTSRATADSLTSLPALPSGTLILLELSDFSDASASIVGEPIPGQPRSFRQVAQSRRFVLIQPEVVTIVEEKELRGIDVGK
jgi:beta-lactamase regulating signal transducer with metallopeptidase domain